MTQPTSSAELRTFDQRAPCGCRYKVEQFEGESGHHAKFTASPYRLQRCLRHMKSDGSDIVGEMLHPLEGIWDA